VQDFSMASSQPITTIQRGPQLIYAGKGLLSFVGSELSQNLTPKNSKYVVITDENINTHYGEIIQRDLKHTLGGKQLLVKVIQPGEESKCREVKASIEDWMIENRCTRDTTIIGTNYGAFQNPSTLKT
jgi:pentafunctional AROM polypeptide